MDDLSTFSDDSPARNVIDQVTHRLTQNGRRYRPLDPTGKDRELIQLIADPAFSISGLTNKTLRQHLKIFVWPTDARINNWLQRSVVIFDDFVPMGSFENYPDKTNIN